MIQLLYRGAPGARALGLVAIGLSTTCLTQIANAGPTSYLTLNFEGNGTFLTGIRGDNIVGNYTIPGTNETGGLYYNITTQTWSAMPVATPNNANYPGAVGSSPYGPHFGNPGGVLRVVGSYKTTASGEFDLSYIYDAAAAPGEQLTELVYPDGDEPTLFTIAHSNFGNQVVGNYDTQLDEGHAFIYNIDTGGYEAFNIDGAVSTTAYGIYGDKIAGGYATLPQIGGGLGPERGYIYDQTTGEYKSFHHPEAVATHFEGITSAGRPDEYNLVVNWVTADGVVHPGVMHVNFLTGVHSWHEIDIPGAVVSSNSAYGDNVVGIYVDDDGIHGYLATIPGIYNPTRNTDAIDFADENATALDGVRGEDIINSGNITATGAGGVGIRGETYGAISNSAVITASGLAGAAAEMHGKYGTLLNSGTLQTSSPEADALRTGLTAEGTTIVNTGIIDGRIAATAGAGKRFENSGWLGVSGNGVSIQHLFQGTLVQTAAGTYAARITDDGNDRLEVTGAIRLDGTMAASFQTANLLKSYTLIDATDEITGRFDTFTTSGLPALFGATLNYAPTTVTMNVAADLAELANSTPNQRVVGAALDGFINTTSGNMLAELPDALAPLYGLTVGQLPGALDALSGEAYASQRSVLLGDSLYARQSILARLRQGSYAGEGALGTLAFGGPLAYGPDEAGNLTAPAERSIDGTFWAQGFGGAGDYDTTASTAGVDVTLGGIVAGLDARLGDWLVGGALGYTRSSADVDALVSSSDVDSLLVGLYAGTSLGPSNFRFGGSYAFSQIEASRTISGFSEQAKAEYDGGVAQVFAEVSHGFDVQQVALEPFAGLAYVHVSTDSFTETGASAGLRGASSSMGVGYSSLGLRAATTMQLAGGQTLKPHAEVTWQHAFGDVTPESQMAFISVPTANFTVAGAPLSRDAALLKIGLDLDLNDQVRIGVSYLGQYADNSTVNGAQADLRWRF
ncbi:autotransporter domain-containing protein [Aureimonas fodinaquatilis]|uniref:Autotransporter domain-containing protein n=1 Tax=Aureimonas fodinaquatilis TaxID=2565783 RepID=A0A5B0DTK3_9HYPH|nr:autotransporter domain-containing protein [Aureimonas fodinaquatilis]KAA0969763.1 autotransporter domain-containing protein [Aureimonas fodinaquatilis]